jgi:carbon monoxide dehydrogenase subunit G
MEVRALHLDDAAKRGLKLEHEVHIGCATYVLEDWWTAIWEDLPVLIERQVEIARPVEEVFAFLADPRNDPRWCPKVQSVEGTGDLFQVVHKPVPLRPPRSMEMRRVASEPPTRIEWGQDDGTDVFRVTYELEPSATGTLFKQTSEAQIGAVPRMLYPVWRHGIGRDMARQMRQLKRLLENT